MGTASLGKRTIYRATQTLGYEVDGYPQELKPRTLVNGVFNCKEVVEYIDVSDKAVRLFESFYLFNTGEISEAQDVVLSGEAPGGIVHAVTNDIIRFEKNAYVLKNKFDVSKSGDQQSSSYQPISGLDIDSTYLTLKTENFNGMIEKLKPQDLIYYQGAFWVVEETRETFTYSPREKMTLHFAMKQIKK